MPDRPYTLLSCCVSLDGYLDDAGPERLVLSPEVDLDRVDAERAGCDAILVVAETVRRDDPRLLVRSESCRAARVARGLPITPLRVTVTRGGGLPPDARIFLELLIRLAPETPAVRSVATRFEIKPSTLMSRFARAGLPSPKTYLAALRLLYAAQFFEGGGRSVADVAYRLDCSSPQSFGRTIRAILGITPGEFRRRFPFPTALERFLAQLVVPYGRVWAGFHPLRGSHRDG